MNVILKQPIRVSRTETLPAGTVKPKGTFGKSEGYLLERGVLALQPEPPKPEGEKPPAEAKPEPKPEPPKVDPTRNDFRGQRNR